MAAGSSTAAAVGESTGPSDRGRALFELATAYLLILTVIWTPRPWQARIYFVAAAFIAWATWRSWAGANAMGWGGRNLLRSAWVIGAAALVSVAAIACAVRLGTLHAPLTPTLFAKRFIGYLMFACIQQFLLQDFFLLRLLAVGLAPRNAVLAAATIFAVAHLPSPILVVLTFVWGVIATAWFLRYRSLYALAVAHMILGVTLAICVPGPTIRNMRVGLSYLTYRAPNAHHLNH
ncbi:MAG TPA: CPBP family intramembrane glutamic endopeptidase [Acidobacteriaceae bacterium]|nr:CPBP family intramembrane glutamic endopeptidase [Acidobacteriaceae bacterium]